VMHVKKPRRNNLLKLRQLFRVRPRMIQKGFNKISGILHQQRRTLMQTCNTAQSTASQSQKMIAQAKEIFEHLETIETHKDPHYLVKTYFQSFKWSLLRELLCNLSMLVCFVMLTQQTRKTI
jgi:hypothetical protein